MNRTSVSRPMRRALVAIALLLAAAGALTQLWPALRASAPASAVRPPPGALAPAAPGIAPAEPRFAANSDRFELVGVLEGRRLTLWLDRFADNAPVTGATLELEVGDVKVVARAVDDHYEAELASPLPAGTQPVTVTVTAGDDLDLLAADLVVPASLERTR